MGATSSLRPPLPLALAKAAEQIPTSRTGMLYEPKWDGFRAAIHVGPQVSIWSRQGRDLTGGFPDIIAAVSEQVPAGTVIDGELVVWVDDRLQFPELLRRVGASARSAAAIARARPASFAAFDLLAVDSTDTRTLPLRRRRQLLEELGRAWVPPLHVSPATRDVDVARAWFQDMAAAGIEGIVAKAADGTYRGGQREWVKVKRRTAVDVVLGAVVGRLEQPSLAVAGLPIDGTLRIVGRTAPLAPRTARILGTFLTPAGAGHPWPTQVVSSTVNGFGHDREPVTLTLVEPVVMEVSADAAWSGRSFRHLLRYVALRPDLDPGEVTPPTGAR